MTFKRVASCIALFFLVTQAIAQSSRAYCVEGAGRYDLHVFGFTFSEPAAREMSKKMLMDFRLQLQAGENLRVFSHTPNGYSVTFDQCVPGCAENGILSNFFRNSCSEAAAMKDLRDFDSGFAIHTLRTYENVAENYDISKSFRQLTNALPEFQASDRATKYYAVISMEPAGVDPYSREALNRYFRAFREAQANRPSVKLPVINLMGVSTSKELKEFWRDVLDDNPPLNFLRY